MSISSKSPPAKNADRSKKPRKTLRKTKSVRLRRSAETARSLLLDAAEVILTREGPEGLKLQLVAKTAGVTPGNVLHHFVSIEGVQTALLDRLTRRLADSVIALADASSVGQHHFGAGIEALFAMFGEPAIARLGAWMIMRGDIARLTSMRHAFDDALTAIKAARKRGAGPGHDDAMVENLFLLSTVTAMGVGLFGPTFSEYLGWDKMRARDVALQAMIMLLSSDPASGKPKARRRK